MREPEMALGCLWRSSQTRSASEGTRGHRWLLRRTAAEVTVTAGPGLPSDDLASRLTMLVEVRMININIAPDLMITV